MSKRDSVIRWERRAQRNRSVEVAPVRNTEELPRRVEGEGREHPLLVKSMGIIYYDLGVQPREDRANICALDAEVVDQNDRFVPAGFSRKGRLECVGQRVKGNGNVQLLDRFNDRAARVKREPDATWVCV